MLAKRILKNLPRYSCFSSAAQPNQPSWMKPFDQQAFIEKLRVSKGHEPEFMQAVEEMVEKVGPFVDQNPIYKQHKILERLVIAERIISFRVPWVDDNGEIQVNCGFRIQFNSAIGPYKGGLRFHPTVNQSILKFLGFEQIFKNALTTLAMGGGKGGADFDPKGKSDAEVMRFCQAFMSELCKHVGAETDVPAGDIGVGGREIGYMFGQYKKLRNEFTGVLTGKGPNWGGSLIRPEATGYGLVYFTQNMFQHLGESLEGKTVAVSGSGNVAQYTIEKCNELGAKCVTVSDSNGTIVDLDGINAEKLEYIKELKNVKRGRIQEYTRKFPAAKFYPEQKPWTVLDRVDVALPCATQNELNETDAVLLLKAGVQAVAEGANMPCTLEATHEFARAKILFGPGKAANAGGVSVSGLEMSQNSQKLAWTSEKVDSMLQTIMGDIHSQCVQYGASQDSEYVDYVKGANISGFVKVADAMIDQGVV